MSVSLDVQLPGYEQYREKIVQGIKQSLESNGIRIAEGGNAKLVVSVKPGEVKQVAYRNFGQSAKTAQAHSVATQVTSLRYEIDGKAVWSGGGVVLPTFVRSTKGESVDAAITRQINETIAGLANAQIPKYVANLPAGKAAGSSKNP